MADMIARGLANAAKTKTDKITVTENINLDTLNTNVTNNGTSIASLTQYSNFWTPKNYLKKLGVCLEDTSLASDWTIPSNGCITAKERVSNEKLFETGAIMFTAIPGGWKGVVRPLNYDFTDVSCIAIAFYVEDQYVFNTLEIRIASTESYGTTNGNSWTKYMKKTGYYTSVNLHRGWNYLNIPKTSFSAVGDETWGVMKAIQMIVTTVANKFNYGYSANDGEAVASTKFGIGGIYLDPSYVTPKLMLNFDDSSKLWYANGFPYLRQKGIKGTMFVCYDHVAENGGNPDFYMNEVEHDVIYAAGFDIGNHSKTHGDLFGMTESQIRTEYGDTQDYLVGNGWLTGGWLSAPPKGKNNYITNKVLYELGYKFIRGNINSYIYNINSDSIMMFPTREIKKTTAVATVTGWIDTMISEGASLSIFTHHVVDSDPDAYSILTADFKTIIDYAVTLRDAGQIEIVTMSEFYNGLSDKSIAQRGL